MNRAALLPLLLLFPSLLLPAPSVAQSTVNCHCFQQRSFDPGDPGTITPYLLATCQNSLFAATHGVAKRAVVQARMGGTTDIDLWLAYALAPAAGVTPETLLALRSTQVSWAALSAGLRLDPENLDPRLMADLAVGRNDGQLADRVVTLLLERDYGLPSATTLPMLRTGLPRKELLLATYLALRTGTPLDRVLDTAPTLAGGWGEVALRSGIDPREFEQGWPRLRAARAD